MSNITIENILEDSDGNIISVVGSKILNKKGTLGYVVLTREDIISLIKCGDVFYVKALNHEVELLPYSKVNLVTINGKQYLRVDEKEIPCDELILNKTI